MSDTNYMELLPEIAKIMNMPVSQLKSKPVDILQLLCHVYQRNYKSDKLTIQLALCEFIKPNEQTKKEIEAARKEKEESISSEYNKENQSFKRNMINRMEQVDRMLKNSHDEMSRNEHEHENEQSEPEYTHQLDGNY